MRRIKYKTLTSKMRVLRKRMRFSVWQILAIVSLIWIVIFTFSSYNHSNDRKGKDNSKLTKNIESNWVAMNEDAIRNQVIPVDSNQQNGPLNVLAAPEEPEGPGEMGRPVVLKNLTKEQKELHDKLYKRNYLNEYVSDMISLHRSLPDVRPDGCKHIKYPVERMPQVSVIVCFHNEAFSVLMRTVHSIIDRSPPEMLKEIILVDDLSDTEDMGTKLENYVSHLPKVKLVRCQKREGLIRGRLAGAKESTAPVLVFLDSHCECTEGWLEPMVYRIHQNESNVVVPVIDAIDDVTLEYKGKKDGHISVGGFDWNLIFNWHPVPKHELQRRENHWDPIRTPTMAGGLFAISKNYFERIGTYDAGMDFWGGENLELSFKTWQCGGILETIPCSHVGHIFRKNSPHKWDVSKNPVRKNTIRVALVWLDEYKELHFDKIGRHNVKPEHYGDVSERIKLREKLKCKKFQYFIDNVWPEIFLPSESIAKGAIKSMEARDNKCLDKIGKESQKPAGIYQCHGQGGNQYWMWTQNKELRVDDMCLDYSVNVNTNRVPVMEKCHNQKGNQLWHYDITSYQLYHNTSASCIEITANEDSVIMSQCDKNNSRQHWKFQFYNASLLTLQPRTPGKQFYYST